MNGATVADTFQSDLDRERIAKNPVAARVQEFNQGAPIVGEWLDEAVGLVSPEAARTCAQLPTPWSASIPCNPGAECLGRRGLYRPAGGQGAGQRRLISSAAQGRRSAVSPASWALVRRLA